MKTCKRCQQTLPGELFYRSSKGGLSWACKECVRKMYHESKHQKEEMYNPKTVMY